MKKAKKKAPAKVTVVVKKARPAKKAPAPKHEIKTKTPAYRFSAGKAAATTAKRAGRERKPAKLPTSLGELPMMKAKLPKPPAADTFICTPETPYTSAVTAKLTLHPAAVLLDGERSCRICGFRWEAMT